VIDSDTERVIRFLKVCHSGNLFPKMENDGELS
jgi:hypothetical protein